MKQHMLVKLSNGRLEILPVTILAIGSLLTYIFTLSAFVTGGDNAELIAAASELGVAHPPGYPLFTLLGHMFTYIPFSTVAWRVNFFAAVSGSLTGIIFYLALMRLGFSRRLSFFSSAMFMFSPLVWQYATEAEVFSLNNLFIAGLFYGAVAFEKSRDIKWLYALAVWSGLALTNHHIYVFFLAGYFGRLVWTRQVVLSSLIFVKLTLSFLLPLGFYFYLPLAAAHHPLVMWGQVNSLDGLISHIMRSDYGTFRLAASEVSAGAYLIESLKIFSRVLTENLIYVGVVFLAMGLALHKKLAQKEIVHELLFWLTLSFVYLVLFNYLSNLSLDVPVHVVMQTRFWQPLILFSLPVLALGVGHLTRKFNSKWQLGLILTFIAAQWGLGFYVNTRRPEQAFHEYARQILGGLSENAVLLSQGDHVTNPIRYLQIAESYRRDVAVVDMALMKYPWFKSSLDKHYPQVVWPGPQLDSARHRGYSLVSFIQANITHSDVYVCNGHKPLPSEVAGFYNSWPNGLCELLRPKAQSMPPTKWLEPSLQALEQLKGYFNPVPPQQSWEFLPWAHLWESQSFLAAKLLEYGQSRVDLSQVAKAVKLLEQFTRDSPFPKALVYKNLGIGYQIQSAGDPSKVAAMREAWQTYLRIADPRDPQVATIRQILKGQ